MSEAADIKREAIADALRDIIKAKVLEQPVEPLIFEAAQRFDVSRATVFRWLKKFKDGDARLSALKEDRRGPKKGEHRKIPEAQHDLIVSLLEKRYMQPERPNLRQIVLEIGAECKRRGFHPPTRCPSSEHLAHLSA